MVTEQETIRLSAASAAVCPPIFNIQGALPLAAPITESTAPELVPPSVVLIIQPHKKHNIMAGRQNSVESLNLERIQTLDMSAATYKKIVELQDHSVAVLGHRSGRLDLAIPNMEETVVVLADEVTGGDMDKTREELGKRGLDDIL